MRKFIPRNLTIILSGLILFLLSCTPESCFEETESFLKATLYLNETGILRAPDSLTVYGLNMETNKLYDKTKKIQIALLPLNASTTNCLYIIRINGITDTLVLNYSSYPHLVSKECGYTFYHKLISDSITYTTNAIDSIYIRKNTITTFNEENIRIFY
ncbi:MAG: DUF6452 family protein [Bacteroidales bacterium]|nr:DUF6452 family protein [Bacteroidales bacterium]